MTTIVYRDGVVAADSQTSAHDCIDPGPRSKLERRPNGDVYAIVGNWMDGVALKEWIIQDGGGHKGTPQPNGDCTVIVFSQGAVSVFSNGGSYDENPDPFRTWGTGSPAALGALYAGASAAEAVAIACKIDPWSGGPVLEIALQP